MKGVRTGKIVKGKVVDDFNGTPIEFANIVIYSAKDSVLVSGVMSDKKGKFLLDNIYLIETLTNTFDEYKRIKTNNAQLAFW